MENICMEQELSIYNLDGKWNDYIGVQKEILQVLREQNFFEQNEVVNTESNIAVRITSKGIRETIGNEIAIDDKKVGVRVSIKKKVGSNHFWIHNIDEK